MSIAKDMANIFLSGLTNKVTSSSIFLNIESIRSGWGNINYNHGCDSDTLNVFGHESKYGIGTHAVSEIKIHTNKSFNKLTSYVGLELNKITSPHNKELEFFVYGDNKLLWQSGIVGNKKSAYADVDISGVAVLTLIVEAEDLSYAHVAWGDLTLYTNSGEKVEVGNHANSSKPPFSFNYNNVSSDLFLANWNYDYKVEKVNDYNLHTVTYTDPDTKLSAIIEAKEYEDCSTLWWTLKFKNNSSLNSKKISCAKTLDSLVNGINNPVLHYAKGSLCEIDDFINYSKELAICEGHTLITHGGRSSQENLPYFNLKGDDYSIVGAIGWTGQWTCDVTRMDKDTSYITAGIETIDTYLEPGEEIRLPSMCLVFSRGDKDENQNDFRKFLIKHNSPKQNGQPVKMPTFNPSWGGMTTEEHIKRINAIKDNKLPYDYYWIDAGWYGPEDSYSPNEHTGDWAIHVGNWQVNPKAHPKGLKYLSDKIHEAGMKFLLWVEPERAIWGTPVTKEHPEFFIGSKVDGGTVILNIADDKACDYVIDFISGLIEDYNLDCFREDFNFDPLPYWQMLDTEDRIGITEIKSINNTYRFWDTLLERYPNLIIDNCASGGRRLDIELMGKSISLWRSDYQCFFDFNAIGSQIQQTGLMPWAINHTGGTMHFAGDTFRLRSCMSTGLVFHFSGYEANPIDETYPFDWHKKMMADYDRVRDYFLGDFYPIIPATLDFNKWASYQLHRDDLEDSGCVFVFREDNSFYTSADLKLKGLNPDVTYVFEDLDDNSTFSVDGKTLLEKGLSVKINNPRESKLYIYKKK